MMVAAVASPVLAFEPWFNGANGHYYQYVQASQITWFDANSAASSSSFEGLPGHLVTITSSPEDAFVDLMLGEYQAVEAWAGGYQSPFNETNPTQGWTWVNAEGAFAGVNGGDTYSNWAQAGVGWWSNQPDDAFGPGTEQFLGLHIFGSENGWNDEGNLEPISGYVVEYESETAPVPEPSTMLGGAALVGLALRKRNRAK